MRFFVKRCVYSSFGIFLCFMMVHSVFASEPMRPQAIEQMQPVGLPDVPNKPKEKTMKYPQIYRPAQPARTLTVRPEMPKKSPQKGGK